MSALLVRIEGFEPLRLRIVAKTGFSSPSSVSARTRSRTKIALVHETALLGIGREVGRVAALDDR